MNFYSKSLQLKILVPVSIVTLLTFITLGVTISKRHRQATDEILQQATTRLSATLLSAIEEPMRIGDNASTKAQLVKIAKDYPDVQVYLTNFRGNVTYSTDPKSIRTQFTDSYANGKLTQQLSASLSRGENSSALHEFAGRPYFSNIQTIPNAPACHHCHGASQAVLGSMIFLQDVSPEFAEMRTSENLTLGISLGGAVVLLLVLLGFIRKMVLGKVLNIAEISSRIRDGDYEAHFERNGNDELAKLSDNLHDMVQKVQDQLQYSQGILEGISTPLIVTDKERRITFVNSPMLHALGKEGQDLTGTPLYNLISAQNADRSHLAKHCIEQGESDSGLLHFTRNDGTVVPLHFDVSPLQDANAETVGAILMMIDMSREEKARERISQQQEKLLEVAAKVTDVSTTLSGSAQKLEHEMDELTSNVTQTSSQTGQVATAMEEMNATVLEVAKNANQAAEISQEASTVAQSGGKEVDRTVGETRQVAKTTQELAQYLEDLSNKADNIGSVMEVISDIADQTNLLALNAAIEAARAGDAGRGFAVVADEVRKLAEKTMNATKEVDHAIEAIQTSTRAAVREMENTRERAEGTEKLAENAGDVLEDIVTRSDSIADMVRSIATAADQQSSTSEEININVSTINELTGDIAERVASANRAIKNVTTMAGELNELIEQFKRTE